jgi:hypothetical protein
MRDATEIDITPEMIEAGVDAFIGATAGADPSDVVDDMVQSIFAAMTLASRSAEAPATVLSDDDLMDRFGFSKSDLALYRAMPRVVQLRERLRELDDSQKVFGSALAAPWLENANRCTEAPQPPAADQPSMNRTKI